MYDLTSLIADLQACADETYRIFNERLTPGIEGRSLGVRMPELRKISRRLLKGDAHAFLRASEDCVLHEIRMLRAIVIARAEMPTDIRLGYLRAFVPTIDNWAVCDLLCNDLRRSLDSPSGYWSFICECAASGRDFSIRFSLVMLMYCYCDDTWIDRALAIYAAFRHEGYYARMGAAWGLSMLFVHQREKTLHFLETDVLDSFTHNKAIQKCIESLQVSAEDKQLLRTLRRTNNRRRQAIERRESL